MESSTHTDILVVAAPSEARGAALADALRQLGRTVTLATTPDAAAQATSYAGTIVTLTPATRDDPTVQAAINARPERMVGFFPEPMILPFGKWSNDPVLLRDSMTDAAARLIAAVDAPPQADVAAAARAAREQAETRKAQRQRITLSIVSAVGAVLAILIVIALRGGDTSANTPSGSGTTAETTPTTVPLNPYSSALLGQVAGCDTGGATWLSAPATLSVTCAKGQGTLLASPKATTGLQYLDFSPPEGTFPTAYVVSVKVTFVSGDANVYAFIGVLGQVSHNGQQLCAVNMAGQWQGGEVNANGTYKAQQTGTNKATLATVTIAASVNSDGSVTCSINHKPVGKPFQTDLTSTQKLFVGMFDTDSTGPFSVRFSNFDYIPTNS